jgi:hypothetical protein
MRRPLLALSALAILNGCDSSNPTRPDAAARVTAITITEDARFTDLNQVHSLTTMAQVEGASPRDITAQATWQSSDVVVATVSSRGEVTSVGFGTARITAMYQGHQSVIDDGCRVGHDSARGGTISPGDYPGLPDARLGETP